MLRIEQQEMFWNYRILTDGEKSWIGEVYYDRAHKVEGFTGPVDLMQADRVEDLITGLKLAGLAVEKAHIKVTKDGTVVGEGR